jgi:serine/threonine protein kinase
MALAHSFVGTPQFAAPEMVRGRAYGVKADVWGIGCILYECVAGHPPFTVRGRASEQACAAKRAVRRSRRGQGDGWIGGNRCLLT